LGIVATPVSEQLGGASVPPPSSKRLAASGIRAAAAAGVPGGASERCAISENEDGIVWTGVYEISIEERHLIKKYRSSHSKLDPQSLVLRHCMLLMQNKCQNINNKFE